MRRFCPPPSCIKLRQIAIDEISIGKGHRYVTIVLDLKSGAVVFVGEGKGAEALERFWAIGSGARRCTSRRWPPICSPAYICAVLDSSCPTPCRSSTTSTSSNSLTTASLTCGGNSTTNTEPPPTSWAETILKGTRWLLLENPENLDPEAPGKPRPAGSGSGTQSTPGPGLLRKEDLAAALAPRR